MGLVHVAASVVRQLVDRTVRALVQLVSPDALPDVVLMALATGYTDFDGLHGVRRDFARIYGSRMGPRYNRQTTFAEITRRASCDARSPNHWTDGFYFNR